MIRSLLFLLLASLPLFALPSIAFAQGETTSAIVGQVTDPSGAAVSGASVTIANTETGAARSAHTDNDGRFNFPQLKPGNYLIKVELQGFEPEQNQGVSAALGQKQTINFRLRTVSFKQSIEVSSEAPILNPQNANTSTSLTARALENLPNPGGDLTYPLQFAPGALINTAGSGTTLSAAQTGMATSSSTASPPFPMATS